jgi:hypothetical protein
MNGFTTHRARFKLGNGCTRLDIYARLDNRNNGTLKIQSAGFNSDGTTYAGLCLTIDNASADGMDTFARVAGEMIGFTATILGTLDDMRTRNESHRPALDHLAELGLIDPGCG